MRLIPLDRPAALVIAHPGHELRVFNWLSLVRPTVFVLTDGSGRLQNPRLHRTTQLLCSLGAPHGSIYGRFTDAEIYTAMMEGNVDLFVGIAAELAEALVSARVEYVVGDASEGYNPAHDVCRLIIDAAVKSALLSGYRLDNFDVLISATAGASALSLGTEAIAVQSNEETHLRKLKAAHEYSELEVEVKKILEQEGTDSLRTEYLRPANGNSADYSAAQPYYETYGSKQVTAGHYQKVIRYREHVLPIAAGLGRFAESRGLADVADIDY